MRRRTPAQRVKAQGVVAAMAAEGKPLKLIAEATGQSVATCWRDLKQAEKVWQAQAVDSVAGLREKELSRLDALERELLDSWKQSKADQLVITETIAGESKSTSSTRSKRHGDARIIQQLHRCIEQRRALLNLDAPKKVDVRRELTEQIVGQLVGILERRLWKYPDVWRAIMNDLRELRTGRREADPLTVDFEEPADAPDAPDDSMEVNE